LKHGVGRDKNIVLVPQPTDSPRDPLNWPLWKRDLIFAIFATNSAVLYAWAEMLAPAYAELATEFNIVCFLQKTWFSRQSYGTVNGQLGWSFIIINVLCVVTNGIGVKYGKRPVFLASNIILLASSIGSIFCTTWNGLLATQLIGTIGRAPYETLVAAVVADLYLHITFSTLT
jgi:MFS family permease